MGDKIEVRSQKHRVYYEREKTKNIFNCNTIIIRKFFPLRRNGKPEFKKYDLQAKSIEGDLSRMDVVQQDDGQKIKGHGQRQTCCSLSIIV